MRSAEVIGWALGGLEREISATKERLAALTAQANTLRARLPRGFAAASGQAAATGEAAPATGKRRRRMSPEARKRISEMMKKRWAERRKRQS